MVGEKNHIAVGRVTVGGLLFVGDAADVAGRLGKSLDPCWRVDRSARAGEVRN